jgi:Na+/proline symporter
MDWWLDIGAALFVFLAAVFWFSSVYGKLPPMGQYFDRDSENDPFLRAVRFSAKMNKWVAGLSSLSALCVGMKPFI